MGLALLVSVWLGGGLLILYFFGNEPSLGRKSQILHLTRITWKGGKQTSTVSWLLVSYKLYERTQLSYCLYEGQVKYLFKTRVLA